jgi:hypothetical protein
VVAEAYGHDATRLRVEVTPLGGRRRLGRAAGVALPLLTAALMSLPIPGWHFLGVPGFLIAAVVLGTRRLRETRLLSPLRGPCPACGREQELPPPPAARFPASIPCPGCGSYLTVREATAGPAGSGPDPDALR